MIPWNPKYLRYFTLLIRSSKYLSWRFGRKYRCADINLNPIRKLMKPGTIVLARKDFQVSNYFIETYWSHIAMIIPGESVIEATPDGVIRKELCHFFRKTDDFALLMPKFCSEEEMEKACHYAMETLGAPYSFDFNNSNDSFYCSELVLKAYARSCGWNKNSRQYPEEFKQLLEGKIVRPSDLFHNQHSWEVVYRLN